MLAHTLEHVLRSFPELRELEVVVFVSELQAAALYRDAKDFTQETRTLVESLEAWLKAWQEEVEWWTRISAEVMWVDELLVKIEI